MDDDVAYRLLWLEQRLMAYEQLHAQELGDMRVELDVLKRQVVRRPLCDPKDPFVQVDGAMCSGCGLCVPACPHSIFELKTLDGHQVARVVVPQANGKWQACAECQAGAPPCVTACAPGAITLRRIVSTFHAKGVEL